MIPRRALVLGGLAAAAASAAGAQPSGGGSSSGASREQQRLTSAESYVPLPTMSVAVLVQSRASGTLVVDVGLDVPDAALRQRARGLQPRVVDALRSTLSTYVTAHYRDRTAPNPAELARLMQAAVDRTLGAAGTRLLIANILYQRRR
jgi:flagellar basal body-associated protein FliL